VKIDDGSGMCAAEDARDLDARAHGAKALRLD
jgi:hypothetical protein